MTGHPSLPRNEGETAAKPIRIQLAIGKTKKKKVRNHNKNTIQLPVLIATQMVKKA
jgi:hypothetical protein